MLHFPFPSRSFEKLDVIEIGPTHEVTVSSTYMMWENCLNIQYTVIAFAQREVFVTVKTDL